jgi:cyclin A
MRKILIDWLVEVAQEYRLTSDTLHLTVDLLNRFLSLEPVAREELQLAGIACMWIASKFEEIYAPTARNFCYITDNTYDQAMLVDMEARVLDVLEFRLALPTAKTFQRRYLQVRAAAGVSACVRMCDSARAVCLQLRWPGWALLCWHLAHASRLQPMCLRSIVHLVG